MRHISLRFPEKVAADLNFKPLQHQSDVSDKLDDENGQLVFHGLGTGKTKTIVNAAHEHGLPLVAIVPAALRNNMRKELESSGFKQPSMVMSYEEALKKMHDPTFLENASKSLVAFDEAHRGGSELGQRGKEVDVLASENEDKTRTLATIRTQVGSLAQRSGTPGAEALCSKPPRWLEACSRPAWGQHGSRAAEAERRHDAGC